MLFKCNSRRYTPLRLAVERTEQEREFYFEKLQDIEFLCQRPEFASETLTKVVERILYFTEGKPDIEAIIAECSAAKTEDGATAAGAPLRRLSLKAPTPVEEAAPVEEEAAPVEDEVAVAAEPQPVVEEEVAPAAEAEVEVAPAAEESEGYEEEVFEDAEAGGGGEEDLDTTVEAEVEAEVEAAGDVSMTAASPLPAPSPVATAAEVVASLAKSPAQPRSPLASQPVNV